MVGAMKRTNKRKFLRRGSAVVEAAVIAPLLITAMLGMIETGYAFMIKQTVSLASREGARVGAMPGATMSDVNAAVTAAMHSPNLSGYTTTSNISSLTPTSRDVSVTVTIPFSRVSFTGHLLGGGSFNISSTTVMRREGMTLTTSGSGGQGIGGA